VKVEMVVMHPDPVALRSMAEDVVAGRLVIPIDRMVPLAEAGAAQAIAEKGGVGKILLLA
jgi:NADPH:quinone reductase-like Zn-dependent oxidoreductase